MKRVFSSIMAGFILLGMMSVALNPASHHIGSASPIDWWPTFQHDLSHIGYSTSSAPSSANLVWQASADEIHYSYAGVATCNGRVIATDSGGPWVVAIDEADGTLLWKRVLSGCGGFLATPSTDGNLVYIVTSGTSSVPSVLYALSFADGHVVWSQNIGAGTQWNSQSPAISQSRSLVIVGSTYTNGASGPANVWAFNKDNGAYVWSYTMNPGGFFSSAAIDETNGKVFIASGWSDVPNNFMQLYCLNLATGSRMYHWTFTNTQPGSATPTIYNGKVYYPYQPTNDIYCFDENLNYQSKIHVTNSIYQRFGAVAVAYGKIYTGNDCYDALTGSLLWQTSDLPSGYTVSPAIADNKVYLETSSPWGFSCYDANSGARLWYYTPIGTLYGSPAISNGKVYFTTYGSQGGLYAFGSVPPRDFGVSVSPSTTTASPRAISSFTVTVTSLNGFNSPVTLTAGTDSAELTATFSSPTVTPPVDGSTQSTMKVSVLSTQLKTHTILVYGISGAVSHTNITNLKVPFLSVPYYYQGDTGWCVPTSVAMVAKYYGISVHPWDVATQLLQGHSGIGPGAFSADLIMNYLSGIGLSGTEKDANFDEIKGMLDANRPVLIACTEPLGHASVITGYIDLGTDALLFVNDPSGHLSDYFHYTWVNPYVQYSMPWSDLAGAIWPGSFIIGVSGNGHTPNPPRGTLSLVGGGDAFSSHTTKTISFKHPGSVSGGRFIVSDVYIWESGFVSNPFSLDTSGLTWRSSCDQGGQHLRILDPADNLSAPLFSYLIVNPTDDSQTYYFEITFNKDGVQKWTSGRLPSSVVQCSHADYPLKSDLTMKDILSEYGKYIIKLFLYMSPVAGGLIDEIDLPPISYVALLNPRSLLTVTAQCPVYLDLYDEHGNCVGYNKTSGTVENQIDGAFWESNQTILIFNPSGTYRLEVTGTDNGTFTSETLWQDVTGVTSMVANFTGTITENETQVYIVGAVPNVALLNILPSKTVVCQGFGLQVNATVADLSGANATFDVTLYASGTIIGTQNALNVSGWDSTTACFAWNTTGLAYGNYTISAYAWPVPGETNTADNNFTHDSIAVTIQGDVDGNFKVDMGDISSLCDGFGSTLGPDGYYWHHPPCILCPHSPNLDVDGNGQVDMGDITTGLDHFGQHYP